MAELQVTPWFTASVNPVRRGLYEVLYDGFVRPLMRLWDGLHWVYPERPEVRCGFGLWPNDQWRGVMK